MQQRQLRLGDILDDYCPRERRVTNHAVVAMVGTDVKQTRCTTCDAEHEYKHAKVPRQRRKDAPAALYSQVAAGGPKRIAHEPDGDEPHASASAPAAAGSDGSTPLAPPQTPKPIAAQSATDPDDTPADADVDDDTAGDAEEGPVHRPLIRATLPRPEGQPPPARPAPDFTIRHPGGRPNRFRPRAGRGAQQQFQGNRSNGNMGGGLPRGGAPRQGGGRPQHGGGPARLGRRHGPKRQK